MRTFAVLSLLPEKGFFISSPNLAPARPFDAFDDFQLPDNPDKPAWSNISPFEIPQFNQLESQVLIIASYGKKQIDAAILLRRDLVDITEARDSIIDKSGVRNMAAAVHLAILGRRLHIEDKGRLPKPLNRREFRILELMGEGLPNNEITSQLNSEKEFKICKNTVLNGSRHVFKLLKATGRTQSIRRAYEHGLFPLTTL